MQVLRGMSGLDQRRAPILENHRLISDLWPMPCHAAMPQPCSSEVISGGTMSSVQNPVAVIQVALSMSRFSRFNFFPMLTLDLCHNAVQHDNDLTQVVIDTGYQYN